MVFLLQRVHKCIHVSIRLFNFTQELYCQQNYNYVNLSCCVTIKTSQ